MKTININIYRAADGRDCTNNGLSSKGSSFPMVVLEFGETSAMAIETLRNEGKDPERHFLLVKRNLFGGNADYIKPLTETRWVMMGGNFGYTSDSRFNDYTGSRTPLPIHDRVESAEQMRALSI